jgi:hypothetical protein
MFRRVYYGWWITAAIVVVSALSSGLIFYSLTVFFGGFEREYGWSRTELSAAISVCFLLGGFI